jgi:TRAP-type C4-dicarboxylate transport system permease small subunit
LGARRVLHVVQVVLGAMMGCGFLFALGLNFLNVILRYTFHAPIYWAEEVMIFTFVWCVFLGAAVVALGGDHLRVGLLEWILPTRVKRILSIVIQLVTAVVMAFVAWRAAVVVELVLRLQQKSIIAEVPMIVPALLIGLLTIPDIRRSRSGRPHAARLIAPTFEPILRLVRLIPDDS